MKFYEVIVAIMNGGKEMGRTAVQVEAKSRFEAAVKATSEIDGVYGEGSYGRHVKVEPLTAEEFLAPLAA